MPVMMPSHSEERQEDSMSMAATKLEPGNGAEQYGSLKLLTGSIEKLKDYTYGLTGKLRRKVTMSEALTIAVEIAERSSGHPTPLSDEDDPRLVPRTGRLEA